MALRPCRRWLRRLVLAAAPCVLLPVVAEILLRAWGRFPPQPRFAVGERESRASENMVADPHTGWRMRPDHEIHESWGEREVVYAANAQGFRSPRDFGPKAGGRRVVVTGDSNTFGLGVPYEQTWPARLEARFEGTEFLNLAMPGFGLDQMWLCVRHQALPLAPDLVVVAVNPADFRRAFTAFRVSEGFAKPLYRRAGDGLRACTPEDPVAVWPFLQRRSWLYAAGEIAWEWLGIHRGVGELWRRNEAFLAAIQQDCAAAGVPVVFVYIPYCTFHPCEALRASAARLGLELVDLTAVPRPSSPTHFDEGHLSMGGHALVAQTLAPRLRDRLRGPR